MSAVAALAAEDLGCCLRGRWLVRGATLSLAPGETLGLVGPNGSGKSTLLRLLAGLLRPSEGTVSLEGRPMRSLARRDIARILAFVAQQADAAERISVREAVALGRTPWLARGWTPGDDAAVAQAMAATDITGLAARDWQGLSGGERQRVHLARALAQAPRVLLLDEPTNHLDISHQLSVLGLLGGLGLSTVVALHDLNQAMGCDRLGVMQAGRLVALGPPAAVLTPALLAEVFGVQARWLVDPEDGRRVMRFSPV